MGESGRSEVGESGRSEAVEVGKSEVGRRRSEVERVKREMIAELSGLHRRWEEVLNQLPNLAAPTVSMETLCQWREAATSLYKQMGEGCEV